MKSFSGYIEESEGVPRKPVTDQELAKLLGKARVKSMMTNPYFRDYSNYHRAYTYEVDRAGFTHVDVFFFFPELHRTPAGKIRPEIMIRIDFSYSGSRIINVHKYTRSKEPEEIEKRWGPSAGWKYLSSWKKIEE